MGNPLAVSDMQLLRCLLLSVLALAARAIHESEVGIVDWHTKLVGVPLYTSHLTKPVFRADTVLTATSNNVLAALNATDGSIGLLAFVPRVSVRDLSCSVEKHTRRSRCHHGVQSARRQCVSSVVARASLIPPQMYTHSLGPLGQLCASTTQRLATSSMKSDSIALRREKYTTHPLLVLRWRQSAETRQLSSQTETPFDASTPVREKRHGNGGPRTKGECKAHIQSRPDINLPSSLVMYTHIYPDTHTSTLYVAGFAKSIKSYTLHLTTLDLATGQVVASVNIPASIANALTDFLLLGPSQVVPSDDAFGPTLVWLSPSSAASNAPLSLFSAPLSPSLKGKVLTIPNTSYKRIQDVDLSGNGLFMAFQDNGTAQVLGYESSGSPVRVVWDFGDVVSRILSMRVKRLSETHTDTICVHLGVAFRWCAERRWEAMYWQGGLV